MTERIVSDDEFVYIGRATGACEVHALGLEGLGRTILQLARERHGKGGLNVCRECLVRARDAAREGGVTP